MEAGQISSSLAHPGKRFQGQFIDGLITYALMALTYYVLTSATAMEKDTAAYTGFAVGALYFLFSDAFPNGQSLGKKLLGLSVVSRDTLRPCSVWQSFARNVTFPLGIFDWIFIFSRMHQRLGDLFASTIVIKRRK
ncbi:MAG: RDD family protein [Pseudomonadota bacterium]